MKYVLKDKTFGGLEHGKMKVTKKDFMNVGVNNN